MVFLLWHNRLSSSSSVCAFRGCLAAYHNPSGRTRLFTNRECMITFLQSPRVALLFAREGGSHSGDAIIVCGWLWNGLRLLQVAAEYVDVLCYSPLCQASLQV